MEKNGPVSPVFSQTAALTLPDLKKARGPRARGTDRRGQIPHMPPMAAGITRLVLLSDGRDGCMECPCGLHEDTPACACSAA